MGKIIFSKKQPVIMKKFIQNQMQKLKIRQRLGLNRTLRARGAVLDQMSGKGLTTGVKRAKNSGMPAGELKQLIAQLNSTNARYRFAAYENEIRDRAIEAQQKRAIRQKKSRYLLSGKGKNAK